MDEVVEVQVVVQSASLDLVSLLVLSGVLDSLSLALNVTQGCLVELVMLIFALTVMDSLNALRKVMLLMMKVHAHDLVDF